MVLPGSSQSETPRDRCVLPEVSSYVTSAVKYGIVTGVGNGNDGRVLKQLSSFTER
jgi:hypothetical protein